MIWLCLFLCALCLAVAVVLGCNDKEPIAVVFLFLGVILFIIAFLLPTKEEKFIKAFEEGEYYIETMDVIENSNGTMKDVAVALMKENKNIVTFKKIGTSGFEIKIINEGEDKHFTIYDGKSVQKLLEQGFIRPVNNNEDETISVESSTTKVSKTKITSGYYAVMSTDEIAKMGISEVSLMVLELTKHGHTHVNIVEKNDKIIATITTATEDMVFLLDYNDVVTMIEEKSIILDNDFDFKEDTAA